MIYKDVFNKEVKVGDIIVHPTTTRYTDLRTSIVVGIESGHINLAGTKVKKLYGPNGRFVIMDNNSLPEDVYFGLQDYIMDTIDKGRGP
jgi:hypothetical protein